MELVHALAHFSLAKIDVTIFAMCPRRRFASGCVARPVTAATLNCGKSGAAHQQSISGRLAHVVASCFSWWCFLLACSAALRFFLSGLFFSFCFFGRHLDSSTRFALFGNGLVVEPDRAPVVDGAILNSRIGITCKLEPLPA